MTHRHASHREGMDQIVARPVLLHVWHMISITNRAFSLASGLILSVKISQRHEHLKMQRTRSGLSSNRPTAAGIDACLEYSAQLLYRTMKNSYFYEHVREVSGFDNLNSNERSRQAQNFDLGGVHPLPYFTRSPKDLVSFSLIMEMSEKHA
jgi:hypothetical protein